MAILQTITNCSDIAKNTDAIVERIGAKLDHLIEWFEREQEAREREQKARDRPFVRLKREWEDREALLERQRLRREEQERLEEKAAVIIQAFLRTTAVRVKLEEAKARARAAAKARKRAKAKQRKQVKLDGDLDGSAEAEAISGGDAITVDERMQSGDEDDSSVPVIGRDAATSIQGVELSLGGASDGTFCEANVGGDNDEKYEDDDFSISEVLPAPVKV